MTQVVLSSQRSKHPSVYFKVLFTPLQMGATPGIKPSNVGIIPLPPLYWSIYYSDCSSGLLLWWINGIGAFLPVTFFKTQLTQPNRLTWHCCLWDPAMHNVEITSLKPWAGLCAAWDTLLHLQALSFKNQQCQTLSLECKNPKWNKNCKPVTKVPAPAQHNLTLWRQHLKS